MKFTKSGSIQFSSSDNNLVYTIMTSKSCNEQSRLIEYRSYKQFDSEMFEKDLKSLD